MKGKNEGGGEGRRRAWDRGAMKPLTSTGSSSDVLVTLGVHCLEILTLTLLKVFLEAWSNE